MLWGCGSGRMAAPADVIAASEALVIQNRSSWSGALADESFQLGTLAVTDVDRDWNSSSDVSVMGFDHEHTKGGYSFQVKDGDTTWSGACTTAVEERSLDLGGGAEVGDEKQNVGCYCRNGTQLAYFSVRATTTRKYTGDLRIMEVPYRISGVYERESGPDSSDPTGYRVDSSNAPIGAVDVINPGRVWISRTLPSEHRTPLACLFGGLLLYQPPSHNFD